MSHVLAVDVGASHVKVLLRGETQRRRAKSGPEMTRGADGRRGARLAEGWEWDAVAVGVPAPVRAGGSRSSR